MAPPLLLWTLVAGARTGEEEPLHEAARRGELEQARTRLDAGAWT